MSKTINPPKNSNYCGKVVKITNLLPLQNCDNVQHTAIMGNLVVVGKDTNIGDIGIYFPVECQLSKDFLSNNNLYRDNTLNVNSDNVGYFEQNGRIRCVKFRGNKSEGLFMPINSIRFCLDEYESTENSLKLSGLNIGDEFDELNGVEICRKYVVQPQRNSMSRNAPKTKKLKESKLIENQFRFHKDTGILYKNLHMIKPTSLISITYKLHGTSGISSYVLCKRKLSWYDKFVKFLGVKVTEQEYDYIYSSRKVIKNEELNPNAQHYYKEDIWGIAHNEIKEFLQKGMTFYFEIVGYLPSGVMIQKDYDYGYSNNDFTKDPILIGDKVVKASSDKPFKSGNKINTVKGIINHPELNIPAYIFEEDDSYVECRRCFKYKKPEPFGIYIYRITSTNVDGKVIEFSAKQVQDFCRENGLNAVPQLYYGQASEFSDERLTEENWGNLFLENLKKKYNEKDCFMCKNKVPEEGVVVRIESSSLEVYKLKSTRFLERETKNLDKEEFDIESEN